MRLIPLVLLLSVACNDTGFTAIGSGDDPDDTGGGTDPGGDTGEPDPEPCEVTPAAAGAAAIDESCVAPDVVVDDPWNVQIEWQWTGLAASRTTSNVIMAPVIGNLVDTDGDGQVTPADKPQIAFVAFPGTNIASGTLVVIDGDGGTERFSRPGWDGGGGIALADLDNDGRTDVVGFVAGTRQVVASRGDGTELWRSTARAATTYPQATVADLDGDGAPEVIADNVVVDGATGALKFTLPDPGQVYRMPAVGDLDQDGKQEIILGNRVFNHQGAQIWTSPVSGGYGHWSAILDYDGDAGAEVAMVGAGRLLIHDTDGTLLVNVSAGGGQPGPPCVADFDGDGDAEIGWASSNAMNLYSLDGTRLWTAPIDDSSGLAACSGYDIDGDGAFEVLFADQHALRILDGRTGAVRYEQGGHASGTLWEYPTVADVDNDGSAEIVIGSNNYWMAGWSGITVFGHRGDGWMKSGTTWHTHDFAVTNILPDGTVPARPAPWWQVYNVYRARPGVDTAATDLQVQITDVCVTGCRADQQVQVAWQPVNVGGIEVPAGVSATLYARDGGALTAIETVRIDEPIGPGAVLAGRVFTLTTGQLGPDGLVLRIDDDGSGAGVVQECDEGNNEAIYNESPCN